MPLFETLSDRIFFDPLHDDRVGVMLVLMIWVLVLHNSLFDGNHVTLASLQTNFKDCFMLRWVGLSIRNLGNLVD